MDLKSNAFCALNSIKLGQQSSWHQAEDISTRKTILSKIIELIGSSNNLNGNPTLYFMVSQIAHRFELSLYVTSNSFEEYSDLNTLPLRVKKLINLFL